MFKVSRAWKAVTATVGAVATALVAIQTDPDVVAVLPASVQGWVALVALPALAGAVTFLKRNTANIEDAEDLLDGLPIVQVQELAKKYFPISK